MTRKTYILFLAATLAGAPALAQAPAPAGAAAAKPAAAAEFVEGEVRKVDRDAAKVTLKHGEIRHLDMPAMSMVFQVKDAALLAGLKAGDKVRFKAVEESGKYFVTELAPLK